MVSFARARTKSWLTRLWPLPVQPINTETTEFNNSKELIKRQQQQKKCFLETSKNGGMWFS